MKRPRRSSQSHSPQGGKRIDARGFQKNSLYKDTGMIFLKPSDKTTLLRRVACFLQNPILRGVRSGSDFDKQATYAKCGLVGRSTLFRTLISPLPLPLAPRRGEWEPKAKQNRFNFSSLAFFRSIPKHRYCPAKMRLLKDCSNFFVLLHLFRCASAKVSPFSTLVVRCASVSNITSISNTHKFGLYKLFLALMLSHNSREREIFITTF